MGHFRENIEKAEGYEPGFQPKGAVAGDQKMEIKEPTRKHKIPEVGESWMKREMRKPFRVMFWILVVCMGLGLMSWLIVLVETGDTQHKLPNKPKVSEERVVTNDRRASKRRVEEELQRAKAEYVRAKTILDAAIAWAEVEIAESNAILQDFIDSLFSPSGELLMPEKQADACIRQALKDNEITVRIIRAKVNLFDQEAREAGKRLKEAYETARAAGVDLEVIAFQE